MNKKQLDLKVNEYIARNVLAVYVGVFNRTCIYMQDDRSYELSESGKLIELVSAPVSGIVCAETLRRLDTMMHTQHRLHGIVEMRFKNGTITYTRTFNGAEWYAQP